jgi:hypothetical protein
MEEAYVYYHLVRVVTFQMVQSYHMQKGGKFIYQNSKTHVLVEIQYVIQDVKDEWFSSFYLVPIIVHVIKILKYKVIFWISHYHSYEIQNVVDLQLCNKLIPLVVTASRVHLFLWIESWNLVGCCNTNVDGGGVANLVQCWLKIWQKSIEGTTILKSKCVFHVRYLNWDLIIFQKFMFAWICSIWSFWKLCWHK